MKKKKEDTDVLYYLQAKKEEICLLSSLRADGSPEKHVSSKERISCTWYKAVGLLFEHWRVPQILALSRPFFISSEVFLTTASE